MYVNANADVDTGHC